MKKRKRFLALGGLALLIVATAFAIALSGSGSDDGTATASSSSTETVEVPGGDQPTGSQIERTAAAEYLLKQGYKLGQFSFTVDQPVYTEHGAASVAEKPILTEQALKDWIQSGSDRSKAYLKYAKENLSDVDYNRVRHGEGFIRVQLLVPSEYARNSFLTGGQVVTTTEHRSVDAGDIVFLYTSNPVMKQLSNGRKEQTSEVRSMGNTRGPCGNPGVAPVPVSGPPAPPITVPPTRNVPGPEPGVTPPSGEGEAPGTETVVTPETPGSPPPNEIPKHDTPSNTPGPTGNGHPQPVWETEPPGEPSSPSANTPPAPGTTSPHPPPPENIPAPPPGSTSPPASDGGSTGSPTDEW